MSRSVLSLEELLVYYRGVFFASVAMKHRLAKLGPDQRSAVREISHYQRLVSEYREALEETQRLHELRK